MRMLPGMVLKLAIIGVTRSTGIVIERGVPQRP